jgi:hypothetical protein
MISSIMNSFKIYPIGTFKNNFYMKSLIKISAKILVSEFWKNRYGARTVALPIKKFEIKFTHSLCVS